MANAEDSNSTKLTQSNQAFWKKLWEDNYLYFHLEFCVHPMLEKHLLRLTENRNGLRFLIPLCGKTFDIKWLASLGHYVCGVELSQLAVDQFFSENDIAFSVEQSDDFKIFTAENERIKIYVGDFFKFESYEQPFDCVWDRGSLVALPYDLRTKYSQHIVKLLKPNFKYLLDTYRFNPESFSGPPYSISLDELNSLYGQFCCFEELDRNVTKHGRDTSSEIVYLMTEIT